MIVEIDQKSGFCFGVVNAIQKAEEILKSEDTLYALGNIVHNELEVKRLHDLGLRTINHETYFSLQNCKVMIRAHGEPPETYKYARKNQITLIDATCPVVLKLQQRVGSAAEEMSDNNGQVVIFGHQGHAEVIGLAGQAKGKAIVIDHPDELTDIDGSRPIVLFSQTTKSVEDFRKLKANLEEISKNKIETHDTVCRQVSNRVPHLKQFAARFDVVIFAGGRQSSNARVLFDVCKNVNAKTYFVSNPDELNPEWLSGAEMIGICGATSTPQWLMEEIAAKIKLL